MCNIMLGGFEYHFGFDDSILNNRTSEKRLFIAQRPPDMTRGTRHFYIYCSLIKDVAINEQMHPVLATVDATLGSYGEQIVHPVRFPLYMECNKGPQQQILVIIADDMGNTKGLLIIIIIIMNIYIFY